MKRNPSWRHRTFRTLLGQYGGNLMNVVWWRPTSSGRHLVVPLAVAWAGATAEGSATVKPFIVGETLGYCLYWTGIPVGQARAMVRQGSDARALKLILSAETNPWIDKLYLVSLKWISTVNRADLAPTRLIMAEQENHRRSQYVAGLDRAKKATSTRTAAPTDDE